MDDLIGQTLGQYEIRLLLGKGGMASVYLAYQPAMDRTVALKVLPPEFLHDDTFLLRFQQEARTIARLEHLHILPVYDVGQDKGMPYIVMRYLSGGTLTDLIATGPLPLATTVRLVTQIAEALDYAHARDIVHRDLKPSNILLDNGQNAYLADFGIAQMTKSVAQITGDRVIGTPAYVAPERVRGNDRITAGVDIYALGIIAYEMLIGRPPFLHDDPMKTLAAHVIEPVPSPRAADRNISPMIDAVIRHALAKKPNVRYRSAGEFARDLDAAAQGKPVHAPVIVIETLEDQATPRSSQPVPVDTSPEREEDEFEEQRGGGWLLAMGIISVIIAGLIITSFIITGGDPASLFVYLTPAATRTPTPTVTLTPGPGQTAGPGESVPAPSGTLAPDLSLPPSGGDRLAFTSNRDGDYEIFLLDIDGTNLRQITDNDANDFDPAWSPDGSQIVFASAVGGDAEITIMQADGTDVRQITDNTASDIDPDWSPGGEWIAFSSNRDGDYDLYLIRPDGSEVQQLTSNSYDDYAPRWSPDGARLGYYADIGGDRDLFVIDATGGTPFRLTEEPGWDAWLDWAPDGVRIAFTSERGQENGARSIYMFDLRTSELIRLTNGPGRDDDPAWSHDGTRLLFDSDRDGDSVFDLFLLDIVSGALQRLTSSDGNDVSPAWQPR